MGDLNPQGVPLILGGEERHLLFTLNAIDEIQSKFGVPLEEAMNQLVERKTLEERKIANGALKSMIQILLNDEVERLDHKGGECGLKPVDEKEAGWMLTNSNMTEALIAVIKAYGGSLPEPDEDEDPNQTGGQQ